jgi:transcriptional accessory protein Tex/SPT6
MCDCGSHINIDEHIRENAPKEISKIINKWVVDNMSRKLLIQEPIYDIYNDIIGYIAKTEDKKTIRIFANNIKQILE